VCYEIGTNIAMLSKILSSIFNKLYVRFWPIREAWEADFSVCLRESCCSSPPNQRRFTTQLKGIFPGCSALLDCSLEKAIYIRLLDSPGGCVHFIPVML
jgi:hypothetical protein